MSREILFRGKRIDNGEWVQGYFCKWPCVSWKELSCVIVPVIGLENGIAEQVIVDPTTIGQFTGLTDKNGIRVWEGDIMALNVSRKFVVCYDEGMFYMNGTAIPIRHCDSLTVIGNIHDNPELMEGD